MAGLLEKIHGDLYWRVVIRPSIFLRDRVDTLGRLTQVMTASRVLLRGWDYPHVEENDIRPGDDWIELGCEWDGRHLEYWRFFRSGQFVHHFAAIERFHKLPWSPAPERYLLVSGVVFTMTEIHELASRLSRHAALEGDVEITVELKGTKDRALAQWHLMDAMSLTLERYKCSDEALVVRSETSAADLQVRAGEHALTATIHVLERFSWFNPPRDLLAEEQHRLLERRL